MKGLSWFVLSLAMFTFLAMFKVQEAVGAVVLSTPLPVLCPSPVLSLKFPVIQVLPQSLHAPLVLPSRSSRTLPSLPPSHWTFPG